MGNFSAMGLPLTAGTWFRLQGALLAARQRLKKNDAELDQKTVSVSEFFSKIKKGSKKFWEVLEAQSSENFPIQNIRCVRKFAQLTDTTVPENKNLAACLGNWYHSYLPNDFRNFLFLFRNNQLPLNNRINAFDDTVDPRCTFCRIIDNNTASRDGLSHVFCTCIVTDRLIAQLINKLEPIPDPNSIEFKHMYWYGSLPENPQLTPYILLVFDTFRYVLWKYKLRRKIPNFDALLSEICFILSISCKISTNLRKKNPLNKHAG